MNRNKPLTSGLWLGGALLFAAAAPAPAGVSGAQFYTDPVLFEQTLQAIGKEGKGFWDFNPNHLPANSVAAIDDVLDINTHPINAPGVWQDATGVNLWPPDIDNVQFSSNTTPQGSLTPHGPQGLFYATAPFEGLPNDVLGAAAAEDSFDIISGPPAGDNHTAISFEMIGVLNSAPAFVVTVFNKNDEVIGVFQIDGGANQKVFLGVIAPPGETIQRIDIWDSGGAYEGISSLALHVLGQPPWCQWDCGTPHDKEIGVVDFLALLAQWGLAGASCDFDGGGVGVTDFLNLLAAWGPCPMPVNDECADKTHIDRFDSSGVYTEHLDMYGATPSPDPSPCLGLDPNIHKDIWYCLHNSGNEEKQVTLSGNVDVLAEVTEGCVCPPGPLVACGRLILGNTVFTLVPGQEVCIRLLNDLELPNAELNGDFIVSNEPVVVEPVTFYPDPDLFFSAVLATGKEQKFFWDFDSHNTPPASAVFTAMPLDILSHASAPDDPWTGPGGEDLWPPFVDNVRFITNLNPQGPLVPGSPTSLIFATAGYLPDINNNFLVENVAPVGALDIISGPPAGDNHTAMAFELATTATVYGFPPGSPVTYHVSVYDKNDDEIGEDVLTGLTGDKTFLGVLTKDTTVTIGRIDIFSDEGYFVGISSLWAFVQPGAASAGPDAGTGRPASAAVRHQQFTPRQNP